MPMVMSHARWVPNTACAKYGSGTACMACKRNYVCAYDVRIQTIWHNKKP